MFKALLKTRIAALGAWLSQSGSRSAKRSSKLKSVGIAALMIYAFFAFMVMFGMYFGQIAEPFHAMGIDWLYFTLFGLTAFSLMFIGSVFAVKTQLYEAKDNEFLLSMPIPPKYILGSRMVMLMILNFAFELLVAIPAIIMWVRVSPFSVGSAVSSALIILCLPFLSMAISGLFGWVLALLTGRMRNKTLLTVVFSVIFLGLYFFFFSQANTYIQKLILNGEAIAGSLGSVVPLYWFGNAITGSNTLHLVLSLVIMLLPFVLMYYILSATFIRVATSNRGTVKVEYEQRAMHLSSQSSALLRREMKHLLSSSGYILNAGLGVLFIIAGAIALIIKKAYVLSLIHQMGYSMDIVITVLVLGICLLASTILFTAPSISLEGNTLWIVKSLPIEARDVLKAKLKLHRYITIPAIVLMSIASAVILTPSLTMILFLIIAPLFYVLLSSNIGLICNLKHPNFKWINETQVVKQSLSVLLAMLINSTIAFIPAILYFLLGLNSTVFLCMYTVFVSAAWVFSNRWIMKKGAEIFDTLG